MSSSGKESMERRSISSIIEPDKVGSYWTTRARIIDALRLQDDEELQSIASEYPEIFQQVVNQAKNAQAKWGNRRQ